MLIEKRLFIFHYCISLNMSHNNFYFGWGYMNILKKFFIINFLLGYIYYTGGGFIVTVLIRLTLYIIHITLLNTFQIKY
jgi:hypothetical protein